jgi:hypothetical protein
MTVEAIRDTISIMVTASLPFWTGAPGALLWPYLQHIDLGFADDHDPIGQWDPRDLRFRRTREEVSDNGVVGPQGCQKLERHSPDAGEASQAHCGHGS